MDKEIMWTGVQLDPTVLDHAMRETNRIINRTTVRWMYTDERPCVTTHYANGTVDLYHVSEGTVMELSDSNGWRIGFGIQVPTLQEGRAKIDEVMAWLANLGITLPVSVHAWTPTPISPRTFMVKDMLSLDIE